MREILLTAVLLVGAGCVEPTWITVADEARDALFDRDSGWTGADDAYSIALTGSSSTLWLFADTILDRWSDHAKMIHNSIGIQRGDTVDFFWGPGSGDFFAPRREGTWFWPGDGYLEAGELTLFLHEFTKKGEGAFGFARTGTWIAHVANALDRPEAWRITYEALPWGTESSYFGIACTRKHGTLYVFGALEESPRRSLVVARVRGKKWEFLNEGGWEEKPGKLRRLCDGIGAELTVTRTGERFRLITTVDGMSNRIVERTAETVEGPWEGPYPLFDCPDGGWDPTYFCYAAKAHPELQRDGEDLVVTYCCNTTDFGKLFHDRRIYRPRFFVRRAVWFGP
jgi:hypothetical protein